MHIYLIRGCIFFPRRIIEERDKSRTENGDRTGRMIEGEKKKSR